MSQNFLVLQRQQFFANAKGVELQALIAYKRSIINLQNAMCTLLESNDFEVIKSVPRGPAKTSSKKKRRRKSARHATCRADRASAPGGVVRRDPRQDPDNRLRTWFPGAWSRGRGRSAPEPG